MEGAITPNTTAIEVWVDGPITFDELANLVDILRKAGCTVGSVTGAAGKLKLDVVVTRPSNL